MAIDSGRQTAVKAHIFRYTPIIATLNSLHQFFPVLLKEGPPLWSSGQSFWLQIRRPGFDSRHYQGKKSSGSGTGSTHPREYN
jgi:hypothetical protein